MTMPAWAYFILPDKQPGEHMAARKPNKVLVQISDYSLTASTRRPARQLLKYGILPAVLTALGLAALILHELGLF